MDNFWIAVLGIVQGATEFLPVSSSGHLAAGQMLLAETGLAERLSNQPLTLEILLHMATFFAVIVYFRSEVAAGIRGAGRGVLALFRGELSRLLQQDDGANLAAAVIAGTLITGIVGLTMRGPAEIISKSSIGLGFSFLGCACLLLATRWWPGGHRRLSIRTALLIGAVQGVAVLPGISRSGITIAAGLALGLNREEAARFSFLLSLPAILGAAVLELDLQSLASDEHIIAYGIGGVAAFIVGLAALFILVRLVRGGRLWLFAPYVAAVGLTTMLFL